MVIWDEKRRLLLVKPKYEDRWKLPGGVVEENESPRQTVEREATEEIGLNIKAGQLLAVSYNFCTQKKSESLQWIFYGGVISETKKKEIRVDGEEVVDFKFAEMSDIDLLTKRDISHRIDLCRKAIKTGISVYLEDWEKIDD